MKRTPLFEAHQRLGAKLIEFGGWEMPVQFTSITEEHLAVRQAAGLFDISHMGEVRVNGAGAEAFLNRTLTNDIRKLSEGQGQYTLLCNERGGVIDDLYVYRLAPAEYLLIVNASRIEEDFAWLERQGTAAKQIEVENSSSALGAVAVQGPRVAEFIDRCFPGNSTGGTEARQVSGLTKNRIGQFQFEKGDVWISRTGYTGEDGFEIIAPAAQIEAVWNQLLRIGTEHGLKPAGLGARDTLRTEVCYPLYGHELDQNRTPIEAGLSAFVSLGKGEFIGRSVLAEQKEQGVQKRLVAFKMTGRSAPPRPNYGIFDLQGARSGDVTSGTQSPSLGIGIGMGYVANQIAAPETPIEIEIRGKRFSALVVPKPIYRKPGATSAGVPSAAQA